MLARAVIVVAIMFVAQAVATEYPTCPEESPYSDYCPGIPGCKEEYYGKCKKPQKNFVCCFPGEEQWKVGAAGWEEPTEKQICVCKPGYGDPNLEYDLEEESVKLKSYGNYNCKATCKTCAKGTYSYDGACAQCPYGTTTKGTGAKSVYECSCMLDGWTCASECAEETCCEEYAGMLTSAKAASTAGKRRLSSVNPLAPAATGSNARALLNAGCAPVRCPDELIKCPPGHWCAKGKMNACPYNTYTFCTYGNTKKKDCKKGHNTCDYSGYGGK